MSHSDIIIIVVTLTISSTLGVYVAIRKINHYTRPPVNTLHRSGDIEIVDYIEPSQPIHAYHPFEINNFQFPTYERIPMYPPSYETGVIPSYRSGTLPTYQSMEGININCCLENNINLEIILLVFIFICFLILWKMRNNPRINIFIERFLLIHQVEIRILWIVLAVYFLNKLLFNYSLYTMSILIPFSFFEIDFRDSFEWKYYSHRDKLKISYFKLQSLTNEINLLLLSLVDDVNYSLSLSFISSYKEWQKEKGKIKPLFIDDAIIINKQSDSLLITQFIMENLYKKGYFTTDWLFKDYSINLMDPVILVVTVAIKVKI